MICRDPLEKLLNKMMAEMKERGSADSVVTMVVGEIVKLNRKVVQLFMAVADCLCKSGVHSGKLKQAGNNQTTPEGLLARDATRSSMRDRFKTTLFPYHRCCQTKRKAMSLRSLGAACYSPTLPELWGFISSAPLH